MKRLTMSALFVILGFGIQLAAGQATPQKPQTQPPDTTSQKAGATAQVDVTFAKEAAMGGMMEVELGQLAAQNATSEDVKTFAQRMVTDHGKANEELKTLAGKLNLTLPTELGPKHKTMREKLSKLQGDAFDRAYMKEMVTDHQQDVASFRKHAKSGRNAELKEWAASTLPTLEEHLKMAKEINSKLGAGKGAKK